MGQTFWAWHQGPCVKSACNRPAPRLAGNPAHLRLPLGIRLRLRRLWGLSGAAAHLTPQTVTVRPQPSLARHPGRGNASARRSCDDRRSPPAFAVCDPAEVTNGKVGVIEAVPVEAPGQQHLRAAGSSGEWSPNFVTCATRCSCQALWGFHLILEKPVPNL